MSRDRMLAQPIDRHDRRCVAAPWICLVTDRRRLVPGHATFADARDALVRLAGDAVAAGVTLIQIRERDLEAAQLHDLATAIVGAARKSSTLVVVNDRLDVALASGADGVHLRTDSIPPHAARALAPPGFLIGRSVHHVDEAREHASAVDYLIAGTMFPTGSKPAASRWLGPDGLQEIVRSVSVPVVAIGGITHTRLREVAGAGGAGVAGIGLFLPGTTSLAQTVEAVRAEFDSPATPS
jgi:thiamine-phosphate pyrophosphorylase